jgi:hypothetical protein
MSDKQDLIKLTEEKYDIEHKLAILNRTLKPLRREKHLALTLNETYANDRLTEGERMFVYYRNRLARISKSLNLLKKAKQWERSNQFAQRFVDVARLSLDSETFERIKKMALDEGGA